MSTKPQHRYFKISTDGTRREIVGMPGRCEWALNELLDAGKDGVTPIDNPAPRWSHYVWKLRHDFSVDIETLHEKHGGPYAGTHARYVLRSTVVREPLHEVAA